MPKRPFAIFIFILFFCTWHSWICISLIHSVFWWFEGDHQCSGILEWLPVPPPSPWWIFRTPVPFHGNNGPSIAGLPLGKDFTSSRLFQPVCERGSFLLKPPRKGWNLTCKTPVAAPEQRLRWLTGGPNPYSPPSSSSSSSTSKLSWKAGASWIRLGLFCPNWRHRWDNDFYKQHSDERRGKGTVCKMHKGLHKHIGLCIWNKLKRCLII